jgi:hypothetical protein
MAFSKVLMMVAMTTPLVVGIGVGYFALQAILGALQTAVIRAKAHPSFPASDRAVSMSFPADEEAEESFELAA